MLHWWRTVARRRRRPIRAAAALAACQAGSSPDPTTPTVCAASATLTIHYAPPNSYGTGATIPSSAHASITQTCTLPVLWGDDASRRPILPQLRPLLRIGPPAALLPSLRRAIEGRRPVLPPVWRDDIMMAE